MTLKTLALIVAGSLFAENTCAGQVVSASQTHGIPDVIFVGPSDATFGERLLPLHTPEMNIAAYQTLLNYSIIIENRGTRPIAAYAIRYDFVGPSGTPVVSTITHDARWAGTKFAPGQTRIVTPLGSVDGLTRATSSGIISKLNPLLGATNIRVSLDSVLFADGQFAGPDASQVREKFLAQTHATTTFVAELTQLEGQPDGVLLAKLDAVIAASKVQRAAPYKTRSDVIVERVRQRVGMDATRLRRTLAKSGRAKYEVLRQALLERDTAIKIKK